MYRFVLEIYKILTLDGWRIRLSPLEEYDYRSAKRSMVIANYVFGLISVSIIVLPFLFTDFRKYMDFHDFVSLVFSSVLVSVIGLTYFTVPFIVYITVSKRMYDGALDLEKIIPWRPNELLIKKISAVIYTVLSYSGVWLFGLLIMFLLLIITRDDSGMGLMYEVKDKWLIGMLIFLVIWMIFAWIIILIFQIESAMVKYSLLSLVIKQIFWGILVIMHVILYFNLFLTSGMRSDLNSAMNMMHIIDISFMYYVVFTLIILLLLKKVSQRLGASK